MGNTNTQYQEGDVPRERYENFFGPGFAYYRANVAGRCFRCDEHTNYWFVSLKAKGSYICPECRNKELEANDSNRKKALNAL